MKSKFNCRHFPMKLPKNTRHRMAPKSERFFSMRLLGWNVKSSRLDVLWKRYSENFCKIHKKKPVLVIMRLQRLHCWCFHLNLAKFQVYTTSRNCASETWLVSWKLFWVILGEAVLSSSIYNLVQYLLLSLLNGRP